MLAQRYLSKLSEWSCELSTNGRWKGEGECVRDVSESVEVWGGGGGDYMGNPVKPILNGFKLNLPQPNIGIKNTQKIIIHYV